MEMILLFAQIAGGAKAQGGATVATESPGILTLINVAPVNTIVSVGQTVPFAASGIDVAPTAALELDWEDHFIEHISGTDITNQCVWTSSNTAVATIGPAADPQPVTAVGVGQANITCTIGSLSGFGQMTVSGMVIQPVAVPNAIINTPYTATFTASGGVVTPIIFSITNGLSQLTAAGLHLSGSTLSGTPTATGNYGFTVQVSDSSSPPITGTRDYNLTVLPPVGTSSRIAELPKVWARPHEADFPVPCNTSTHCEQKFVHTSGTTDYPCTYAGVAQSYTDWMAQPANQWREVIVDDGLSVAGQCRITGASQWRFDAKLGATGFYWIHSAHPTPDGETVCNHMTAPDPSVDQRASGCPLDYPDHLWYFGSNTITNSAGPIIMGNIDSAGFGPSHIRISNGAFETTSTSTNSIEPIKLVTNNAVWGDPRSMCSHIGFDHNYVFGDRGDDAKSARGTQVTNGINWGCSGWLNRNYVCCMGRNAEGHASSYTDAQPGSMIVGNWFEANSVQFFVGGRIPTLGDPFQPSDIEIRKNYFTANPYWVMNTTGVTSGNGVSGPGCAQGMGMKNNGEFKLGIRVLFDGNIMQWSSSCGQAGQNFGMTIRSCSGGVFCDAPNSNISDMTITNNVFRHAGTGIQTAGRSTGPGAGLAPSMPGLRWNFINNLFYDIMDNTRHRGTSPNYFVSLSGAAPGGISWRCSAVRDAAGLVTLNCRDSVFRTITGVSVAATPTNQTGAACSICNIVTVDFNTTPVAYNPFPTASSEIGRIAVTNVTGATNLAGTRMVCNSATGTTANLSQGCAAGSTTYFQYRCGNTGQSEPACPVITGAVTGDLRRIGFSQTDQAVGDPTQVFNCTDTTFNTPGTETANPTGIMAPPALAGTNGLQPNGLTVTYQSIPNQPASIPDCTFTNFQGWWAHSIVSHNTSIAQSVGTNFRNPHVAGGGANQRFPYIWDLQYEDNLEVINPAVSNGGSGWWCCNQPAGNPLPSQRASLDWGTSVFGNHVFAGQSARAANTSLVDPNCFKAGNCLRGNSVGTTLWYPALGPCPGNTVTLSGTGFVPGTSSDCIGFNGMMNGVPFLLVSNDTMPPVANGDPLHDYALQLYNTVGSGTGNTCTANCGSPYAAGGPRRASDGTDMGADMNKIRHAFQRTIYDDCSAATGNCGAGPNPE